jgi:hypothetical protein
MALKTLPDCPEFYNASNEIKGSNQTTNLGVGSSNLFGRASTQHGQGPFPVVVGDHRRGVVRVETRERQHRYVRLPDPWRLKFGSGTFRAAAQPNFARARWCGSTVRANTDPSNGYPRTPSNRLLVQQGLHRPQEGLECLLFLSLRRDFERCGDIGRRQPAGGSGFPCALPMPRQCGTCGRPAASRRNAGPRSAAILRQHAPSALRVGKPFRQAGDRTGRPSGTQS